MQNILIILIVAVCAFYVGRRLYRNLTSSRNGGGCGCGCSGCGPEISSACQHSNKSDTTQ